MISNEFEYPNKLNKIFEKLYKYNLRPIIVGGYVRDFFLNKISKDIDIEVYGLNNISELSHLLEEFGKVYEVGKSFGVCKLQFEDLALDFSMPRIDKKISNGHKGFDITTKKELDYKTAASRRDFTINSIGFDTLNKKILDPFNGIKDLENKRLNAIDENSFIEDPLRVFRAVSMCARLEFNVDKNTAIICSKMIEKNMLNELPKERVFEELKKLFLKSKKPSLGFEFLKQIGGLYFFPELNISNKHWSQTMQSLDSYISNNKKHNVRDSITNVKLMLVLLSYHLPYENITSFIDKIHNNKNLAKEIIEIIQSCKILENNSDIYTLKKVATKVKLYEIIIVLDATGLDISYVYNKAKELNIIDQAIPKILEGRDLIEFGLNPSASFSKILDDAYEAQLKSVFENKKDAIKWLKEYIQNIT